MFSGSGSYIAMTIIRGDYPPSSSVVLRLKPSKALITLYLHVGGFPDGASGKEPTCQFRRHKRYEFYPWIGKIPWRRAWQPIPVFLAGESHGQRSLVGYSPWGCKESDTTHSGSLLLQGQ